METSQYPYLLGQFIYKLDFFFSKAQRFQHETKSFNRQLLMGYL